MGARRKLRALFFFGVANMARYKAKTGFDHDGRTYNNGDDVEASESTARELSARGLIEGYDEPGATTHAAGSGGSVEVKDARPHDNKKEPEPNRDRIVGGVGGEAGNRAGDVLAGDESAKVSQSNAKPRQTK